jgi:rhamnose utilization protein RhaD (predicted bifunctional aldolase and dehydrogenase)/NAD(P)-dependent dehydrogenase (short-subunit alcohol dehydrogenase family)
MTARQPSTFDPHTVQTLVSLSRHFGRDPEFILAGGGNTSAKTADLLLVKASGSSLATIEPEGFVQMDRQALSQILVIEPPASAAEREEQVKQLALGARTDPGRRQRPSVECVLHNLIPRRYVIHTHPTLVNALTCCRDGEALAGRLFGDDALWVGYVDPGFMLARAMDEAIKAYARRTGRDCPPIILMQNHGLIVSADTADEIHRWTDRVLGAIRQQLQGAPAAPFGRVQRIEGASAAALVNAIGPILRGLLAGGPVLKIVTFDDGPEVLELVGGADGNAAALAGPVSPDHIVYCTSFPLWFEPTQGEEPAQMADRLQQALEVHRKAHRADPQVVLVKGLGLFAAGDDRASAQTTRAMYINAIQVMAGATKLGGIRCLDKRQYEFIENWEVEAYRKALWAALPRAGRAAGKVALVTGAAQGFGLEIAQDLCAQGAHVVLVDVNAQGAADAAGELCRKHGAYRAEGLAANVTDSASVGRAVEQVVRMFGGLDVLVSNAGVLRAGSVKTQSERDFDLVTAVNYKGYFVCVQKAAPVMAAQRLGRPDAWSDIIQINSKSGLEGSNRNGAYAGSKFGGIGLTQSFALELVEDGIKVNAICPGNFFDGPLWSDPSSGLFVQYLREGKVPGARTIEDVRKFYEAKAPMKRGCTTADVMKAIYYLLDQTYETGQAVPVTGGQVMLS